MPRIKILLPRKKGRMGIERQPADSAVFELLLSSILRMEKLSHREIKLTY